MKISDCEECKVNPWKYKCPGCSFRSCGVDCVKAHKNRTGCTGKRKATDFVPISEFDDNLLLSDYNMLEETKRVAESAKRMRHELVKHQLKIPHNPKSLWGAASSRRTQLLFLPNGMLKREKNQSRYDLKSKCISWTIEWRFHSTDADVVLTDHGVGEDTNLCTVIENHLKPGPWKHKLKAFCDVDLNSLRLFIRKHPQGAQTLSKELDITAPLRPQLTKVDVLEYPVIHVYLPSQSYDFKFYRDFNHRKTTPNPNASLCDGQGNANGIPFREEELEDEDDINSVEPKVVDLFKQRNDNPCQRASKCSKVEGGFTDNSHPYVGPTERGDPGVVDKVEGGLTDNSHSYLGPTELGDADDLKLEFNQEELNIYSAVFPEMNPGDYFGLEFEYAKGLDSDDNFNLQSPATDCSEMNPGDDNFNIDGLEEGEIAE